MCVCVRARACVRACVLVHAYALLDVELSLVHNAPQGAVLRCVA